MVTEVMMSNRLLLVSLLSVALCFIASPTRAQTASSATQGSPNSFQRLVMDIQGMLTELGYRPGGVDGSVGQGTRQAIRRYQSNTGLTVDGQVGVALRTDDLVRVKKAEQRVELVVPSSQTFYDILRQKLQWGGRTT